MLSHPYAIDFRLVASESSPASRTFFAGGITTSGAPSRRTSGARGTSTNCEPHRPLVVSARLEYATLTGEQPATVLLAGYGHAMRALAGWFSTTRLPRRSLGN